MAPPIWLQRLARKVRGRTVPVRPDDTVTLGLVRMEDRVLLDAAGLITDLPGISGPDTTVVAEPVRFAVTETTIATTPSSLEINGDELVFRVAEGVDVANHVVVSSDACRLTFQDQSGVTIAASVRGAIGSGTSKVSIPYSSFPNVRTLVIDVAQAEDTVTFDLSNNANTFLSQFETARLIKSEDHLRFVGNGQLDATVKLASRVRLPAEVTLSNAGLKTDFEFAFADTVDIAGMQNVTLEMPAVPLSTRFVIAEGTSFLDTSEDALVARYDTSAVVTSVHLHDNDSVIIDGSATTRNSVIEVQSAANDHRNRNLLIDVQANSGDAVKLDGAATFTGIVEIRTRSLSIDAALNALDGANLLATNNIELMQDGFIEAPTVTITSSTGRILSGSSSSQIVAKVISFTAETGIGERAMPVVTSADSVRLEVTGRGSAFLRNNHDVSVERATAGAGGIEIDTAGLLDLRGEVRAGDDILLRADSIVIRDNVNAGGDIKIVAIGSASSTGTLNIGGDLVSQQGNVRLEHTGTGIASGQIVAGRKFVKAGSGRMVLQNRTNAPEGTDVQAGSLTIDSRLQTSQLRAFGGTTVSGSGTIDGDVIIDPNATLAPGSASGRSLTVRGDLQLQRLATLRLRVSTNSPATSVNVEGEVVVNGAVLKLSVGQVNATVGTTLTLISNGNVAPIVGTLVDSNGTPIGDGDFLMLGGVEAALSYTGGTSSNDLVLIFNGQLFFIPVSIGDDAAGQAVFGFFVPTITRSEIDRVQAKLPVAWENTQTLLAYNVTNRVDVDVDTATDGDFRLFYRVFDDELGKPDDQEIRLDPEYIGQLPSRFDELGKLGLPDGHYIVYLKEAGSARIREVQNIYIFDGKVVPENFRESAEADKPSSNAVERAKPTMTDSDLADDPQEEPERTEDADEGSQTSGEKEVKSEK